MSQSAAYRDVHPLRTVESIDVSEAQGPELGNPHYFHMDKRYTMTLECGHTQARVSSNFEHLKPADLMPKRVRCKECQPHQVPVREKANPQYDHLAAALAKTITAIDPDVPVIEWVRENGTWIADEKLRARVYGTAALAVFDAMMADRTVKHSQDLREAIQVWMDAPTAGNKDSLRKIARRVYSAQHAPGNDWFAARALVCLGRVAGMSHAAATGIVESLTWDRHSREGFYDRLFAARAKLDSAALRSVTTSIIADGSPIAAQKADEAEAALENLTEIWETEYPQPAEHHLPMLLHLCSVVTEMCKGQ